MRKTVIRAKNGEGTIILSNNKVIGGFKSLISMSKEIAHQMEMGNIPESELESITKKFASLAKNKEMPVYFNEEEREDTINKIIRYVADKIDRISVTSEEILSMTKGHIMPNFPVEESVLVVCKHCHCARIVTKSGSVTGELENNTQAEEFVDIFLENDVINETEAIVLRSQIKDWQIPVDPILN